MARVNLQGLAQFRQQILAPLALKGAEAAADTLREKLSGAGHGRHYARLPNRSSAPGEYPAEQSSRLRDSIAARPAEGARAEFGPIRNPPVQAGYLHFSNEEDAVVLHFRPPSDGGRPFLDDALQDRDIHNAVRQAMGVKGGR